MITTNDIITAVDLDHEHLKRLARCLRDGGYAFRQHGTANAIEIKCLRSNQWMLATFHTRSGLSAQYFATATERDQTYRSLHALQ